MATFGPSQIASNGDDGQENNDTTWVSAGQDSDGARVGRVSNVPYDMGLRFPNVTVPKDSTITSATIEIFMKFAAGDINVRLQGIKESNVSAWSSSNRPSQQTQTTAANNQSLTTASDFSDESYLSLADASTIVDEIVSQAGWASGNAMGFVLKDNGSGTNNRWQFQVHDRQASNAAKLTIVYTEPAGSDVTVTVPLGGTPY